MAKRKKGGKKKGKKRKLPKALRITQECAKEVGIKPFKKWTKAERRKVEACKQRKLRNKK